MSSFVPFGASLGGCSEFNETIASYKTSNPVQLLAEDILQAPVNEIPNTSDVPPRNQLNKTLTAHRENVLYEMIQAFQDEELIDSEIDIEVMLPNGQKEKVLIDHVLSGKDIPNDELVRSFFKYIPEQEQELFQKALDNFTSVEIDELVDILDVYQCKVLPTSS
ncbi:hypothetical protein HOLleu_24890 [Holothuria leucospilota]|uniref:Uncharacterized protein n=1 Tax=Holothuria leucospilota TaxID=206669 RepID=A0A9Q1H454_HOLLE|nr:hypothetical protein HOLleu_24890 [Holothuria leucospilota]